MPDIDPNALIIVVIMVIGGLKWLLENVKGKKEQDDSDAETPTSFVDLYEEARQEIQERQNLQYPSPEAEESAHYEEYTEPTVFTPVATAPPPVPAAIAAPPPLPAAQTTAFFQSQPSRSQLSVAEQAALKRVQEQARENQRSTTRHKRSARTHVRNLLSSPTAARDAIVLREILSTPRGRM